MPRGTARAHSGASNFEEASMPPVSDLEYDVLSTLQSKLEALEVYEAYLEDCEEADDDECRQLFQQICDDDERHAERLREALARMLGNGGS
jgi:bacterioferritin (cytochrome b1)